MNKGTRWLERGANRSDKRQDGYTGVIDNRGSRRGAMAHRPDRWPVGRRAGRAARSRLRAVSRTGHATFTGGPAAGSGRGDSVPVAMPSERVGIPPIASQRRPLGRAHGPGATAFLERA